MAMAIMAAGTVFGVIGQLKQAKAAKKAEKVRQNLMNLEATRKKRELVREGIVARAQAQSNAVAQGAGSGSGIAGGLATIGGQVNRNITAANQDQEGANKIFKYNNDYANGGMLSAFGSGLSSLGSALGR